MRIRPKLFALVHYHTNAAYSVVKAPDRPTGRPQLVTECSEEAAYAVGVQIGGGPVLPVCGDPPPGVVNFPPRDETFAFGLALDEVYDEVLEREPVTATVDLEGRGVWIQESLRYRVNNCGHDEASHKVFTQIRGGGVQPVCQTKTRFDTLRFSLPAGSGSVVVGPVHAGNGLFQVVLNYSGDFIILACVGTQSGCIPMGGGPQTRIFNIPSDFPPRTSPG